MPRESRICAHSGPWMKITPYFGLLKKQDVSRRDILLTFWQQKSSRHPMQALQCIAASPAWGFFMRLQKMTIWFSRSLLHYLPCCAVAHAEDVHATLYAAISLSLKVIDGIHCGWCANGIGLNASRFNCQNCAEATPRWCCLVEIQWGFGNIERSFVDWGIDKDGIITYRGRYFTCHSFERRTICKAVCSQTCHGRRNIDGREGRTA